MFKEKATGGRRTDQNKARFIKNRMRLLHRPEKVIVDVKQLPEAAAPTRKSQIDEKNPLEAAAPTPKKPNLIDASTWSPVKPSGATTG